MKPFEQGLRVCTPRHEALTRRYEIARTAIEFLAALAFIIGSLLFFYPDMVYTGTWLFLIGSIFFAIRPTIRLLLELHLSRLPMLDELEPAGG